MSMYKITPFLYDIKDFLKKFGNWIDRDGLLL